MSLKKLFKIFLGFYYLTLLSSCSFSKARLDYSLQKVGPYLVTNSNTNPFKYQSNLKENILVLTLIVKNDGNKRQVLKTEKSKIIIEKQSFPLECHVHPKKELEVGEYAKINCDITLHDQVVDLKDEKKLNSKILINLGGDQFVENTYLLYPREVK